MLFYEFYIIKIYFVSKNPHQNIDADFYKFYIVLLKGLSMGLSENLEMSKRVIFL